MGSLTINTKRDAADPALHEPVMELPSLSYSHLSDWLGSFYAKLTETLRDYPKIWGLGLASGLFFTIASYNAVYLQSGLHPSPLFAPAPEQSVSSNRPTSPSRSIGVTPQSISSKADPIVKTVQTSLKAAGHYKGTIDGLIGPETRLAVRAYEAAHNLEPTGDVSQKLLAHLQMTQARAQTPPAPVPAKAAAPKPELQTAKAPPAAAPPPLSKSGLVRLTSQNPAHLDRQTIAQIQTGLNRLGYNAGPVDGVWGGQTEEAIRRFQFDHMIEVTGQLTRDVVKELEAALRSDLRNNL